MGRSSNKKNVILLNIVYHYRLIVKRKLLFRQKVKTMKIQSFFMIILGIHLQRIDYRKYLLISGVNS